MEFGYVRVSTREQNEARQMQAMAEQGIPAQNIYMDKQSGKDFDRPQYLRMMRRMKPGDTLFIKSIDRLGRNYNEILQQWRILSKEKGIGIVVLDMPLLDTRQSNDLTGQFIADIVLQLLSYVAETERENIRQRQAEGIAAAKERGVRFGRPPQETLVPFEPIAELWLDGEIDTETACRQLGLNPPCFRKRARKMRQNSGQ